MWPLGNPGATSLPKAPESGEGNTLRSRWLNV